MRAKSALEVQNAFGRLVHVRVSVDESEGAVERLRVDHRRQRVQHESVEAQLGRMADERLDESTANAACSLLGINVEAADFANLISDEQRDNTDRGGAVVDGEQYAARVGVERSELHELRGDVIESGADLGIRRELGHGPLVRPEQTTGAGEVLVGRCDHD